MSKITWLPLHDLPFEQLARTLATLGWRRAPEAEDSAPWVAGQPDLAVWHRIDAESSPARLHALYEPSTGLRSLRLEAQGEESAQLFNGLTRALPVIGDNEIRTGLFANDERVVLRAIQAAEQRGDPSFIAPLNELVGHSSRIVQSAARGALVHLLEDVAHKSLSLLEPLGKQLGKKHLAGAPMRIVFESKSLRERCQIVRWLPSSAHELTPAISAVLEAALADSNWELRLTAALVATRLRAVETVDLIHDLALPRDAREGVTSADVRLLAGLRAAALSFLQGAEIPADPPTLDSRSNWRNHLLRCVAGVPVTHRERGFLWAHALTTPFDPVPPEPASSGSSSLDAETPDTLHSLPLTLMPESAELSWVGKGIYWLGDDLPSAPEPIRSLSGGGFWMSRKLLRAGDGTLWQGTLEDARALTAQLAEKTHRRVRLPAPDEWEMSARGTDGRRFPWGNALMRHFQAEESPWGLREMVGVAGQWLDYGDAGWIAGTNRQLACAQRRSGQETEQDDDRQAARAGVRLLVEA